MNERVVQIMQSVDTIAMFKTQAVRRRLRLLWIALASFSIPACSAPNGAPHPWLRPFSQDANVVQRPTYDTPQEKTFFLSGYAGHDYGPLLRARPAWIGPAGTPSASVPNVSVGHGTWEPE
jgi:hypothetical protein